MNTTFEKALEYRARGWSVIPLQPGSKLPSGQWREFQDEIASEELIAGWFKNNHGHNIGIVTGRVSDLLIIDLDSRKPGDPTWDTLKSRTPRGIHYYFKPEEFITSYSSTSGIDIKCEGGYVVVPPSISSDTMYKWGDGDAEIAQIDTRTVQMFAPRRHVG